VGLASMYKCDYQTGILYSINKTLPYLGNFAIRRGL
jgi:hypothetical protein